MKDPWEAIPDKSIPESKIKWDSQSNKEKVFDPLFWNGLALLFIFFKLFPGSQVNDWPWIWVLSPIWGPPFFVVLSMIVVFVVVFVSRIFLKYFGVK